VALVDHIGPVVEGVIDEFRDESAVGRVVLPRSIAIDRANTHGFRAELFRRVEAHELTSPLRDRVVIQLPDRELFRDVLGHDSMMVAVDFSAAEEDKTELEFLLKANQVLGSYHVRLPEILVVVFAVPSTILCRQVINTIEPAALNYALELAVFTDVASNAVRALGAKSVTGRDFVHPGRKLADEVRTDEPCATGH